MENLRQSKYDRGMKLSTVCSSSAGLEYVKPIFIAVVRCFVQMYMCVFTCLATLTEVYTLSIYAGIVIVNYELGRCEGYGMNLC